MAANALDADSPTNRRDLRACPATPSRAAEPAHMLRLCYLSRGKHVASMPGNIMRLGDKGDANVKLDVWRGVMEPRGSVTIAAAADAATMAQFPDAYATKSEHDWAACVVVQVHSGCLLIMNDDCPATPSSAQSDSEQDDCDATTASSMRTITPADGPVLIPANMRLRVSRYRNVISIELGTVHAYVTEYCSEPRAPLVGAIKVAYATHPSRYCVKTVEDCMIWVIAAAESGPADVSMDKWGPGQYLQSAVPLYVPDSPRLIIYALSSAHPSLAHYVVTRCVEFGASESDDAARPSCESAADLVPVQEAGQVLGSCAGSQVLLQIPATVARAVGSPVRLDHQTESNALSTSTPYGPAASSEQALTMPVDDDVDQDYACARAAISSWDVPVDEECAQLVCYAACAPSLSMYPKKGESVADIAAALLANPLLFALDADNVVDVGSIAPERAAPLSSLQEAMRASLPAHIPYTTLVQATHDVLQSTVVAKNGEFAFGRKLQRLSRSPAWTSRRAFFEHVFDALRKSAVGSTRISAAYWAGLELLVWYYVANVQQPFLVFNYVERHSRSGRDLRFNTDAAGAFALEAFKHTDVFYTLFVTIFTRFSWAHQPEVSQREPVTEAHAATAALEAIISEYATSSSGVVLVFYILFLLAYRYNTLRASVQATHQRVLKLSDVPVVFDLSEAQFDAICECLYAYRATWVPLMGTELAKRQMTSRDARAFRLSVEAAVSHDESGKLPMFSLVDPVEVAMSRLHCQLTMLLENNNLEPFAGDVAAAAAAAGDDQPHVSAFSATTPPTPSASHRESRKRKRRDGGGGSGAEPVAPEPAAKRTHVASRPLEEQDDADLAEESSSTSESEHGKRSNAELQSASLVVCPMTGKLVVVNCINWFRLFECFYTMDACNLPTRVYDACASETRRASMRLWSDAFLGDSEADKSAHDRALTNFTSYLIKESAMISTLTAPMTYYYSPLKQASVSVLAIQPSAARSTL